MKNGLVSNSLSYNYVSFRDGESIQRVHRTTERDDTVKVYIYTPEMIFCSRLSFLYFHLILREGIWR